MPTSPSFVRRPARRAAGMLLAAAIIGLLPASALAQNAARDGKWTLELYGGGSVSSASTSGTPIGTFPAGATFIMDSGQPSRMVSSWYFGDGAALLNQVLTQLSTAAGTTFPRIVPLDSALAANGGSRGNGGAFGLRVGRSLTSKLAFELNVERSMAQLELSDDLQAALKTSSDSFEDAFTGMLTTGPLTNLSVTSTLTTANRSNAQTRIAGALKWTVLSRSRLEAYVTGGGGIIRNSGDGPEAILNGRYTFRLYNLFSMDEIDRVVVSVTQPKTSTMGLVGGGVTYDLTSGTGLRADVRLLLNSTKDITSLTAAPALTTQNPTNSLTTLTSPGIQFSTRPGFPTSLSGPNQNLTLFTGSGLNRQISFTLGIFTRF